MIERAHFILYVRDQAASARFYRAALAREPSLDVPGMTEFHLAGGAVLGLMPQAGIESLLAGRVTAGREGNTSRAELYLLVDDVAACYERALAAGALALDPPAPRDWGELALSLIHI